MPPAQETGSAPIPGFWDEVVGAGPACANRTGSASAAGLADAAGLCDLPPRATWQPDRLWCVFLPGPWTLPARRKRTRATSRASRAAPVASAEYAPDDCRL